jgi:short-subunit dehydrogenase
VTEFHDHRERVGVGRIGPRFLWGPAEQVVSSSLAAFDRRRSLCVPGAINKAVYLLARLGIADLAAPLALVRGT